MENWVALVFGADKELMTREDIYTQQFERTKGNWIFILFFVV